MSLIWHGARRGWFLTLHCITLHYFTSPSGCVGQDARHQAAYIRYITVNCIALHRVSQVAVTKMHGTKLRGTALDVVLVGSGRREERAAAARPY